MKTKTYDETQRWHNYRLANSLFPNVRANELQIVLQYTAPKTGDTVAEIGTGNGYLTFAIAKQVGHGQVHTFDYQKSNLDYIKSRTKSLPITTHQIADYRIPLADESCDKVTTTATLHHYDDRSKGTGMTGRKQVIEEFSRILKKNGTLTICDIANDTKTQKYFDSLDHPYFCHPRGHPHDFLDNKSATNLCRQAGFTDISYKLEETPLVFDNTEQAAFFMHLIHNARCTPEESLQQAQDYLGIIEKEGKVEIGWNIFCLTARKD